jgi:transposase InsO family protein
MMDYFGPLLVTVGRHKEKRYGVIFVCLTTRAVHIELAETLDTSSCILAVRNFINRRGPPVQMWSDNGTNLRGAEKELREAIEAVDKSQLVDETQSKSPQHTYMEWKFSPPSAAHFNGAVERMVGLVKKPLYRVLKSRAP